MFTKLLSDWGLPECNQCQLWDSTSSVQTPAANTIFLYLMLFFINFNIHIVLFCWYQPFYGMEVYNAMQAEK